jgi:NAD(P)-dependent dehydrogenase (short-subunit alcohol dehydrogenase family)
MVELNGKRVVVTGGASGIGRETVRLLAAGGAIVIVADIDGPGAEAVAREVGGTATVLDVADPQAWQQFADATAGEGLDLAVLNAGVLTGEDRLAHLDETAYLRALSINVGGVVHGIRALTPLLAARRGAFAVTASLAGLVPFPTDPIYALTKHALVGFVRSVAPQLAADGVRVNLVCPGMTDTALVTEPMQRALAAANFPLMAPGQIAAALVEALRLPDTGQALVCQPGRVATLFRFPNVPGPVVEGAGAVRPPDDLRGGR